MTCQGCSMPIHLATEEQLQEAARASDALRVRRMFTRTERRTMARAGALPVTTSTQGTRQDTPSLVREAEKPGAGAFQADQEASEGV